MSKSLLVFNLWQMTDLEINRKAIELLDQLLQRCTLNLVANLTGITRVTLYRWLDTDIALDDMNHRDAAWFILMCETSPKVQLLLQRPPMSKPRMAKRFIDDQFGDNHE